MQYAEYHALGNGHIVIHPVDLKNVISRDVIRLICHRNYGVGSDGILLGTKECEGTIAEDMFEKTFYQITTLDFFSVALRENQ